MSMTINVTERDIVDGYRYESESCPISLAAKRAGIGMPAVGIATINGFIKGTHCNLRLPIEAQRFVEDFDAERSVSPFTFELETPCGSE